MMLRRWILSLALLILPLWAHADWAADRDASAGYVTVTTLATAVDEAVPFCVVYLSDLPADFHTAMSDASDTDGKTIRVSTSDGTTQLACVPIGVNTGTDTGCLIFLGTGMSASVDVDYRIYVGNAALSMPSASGGMGEQAVFASYAGVYFPGVDTRDWTAGGRTLTAVGTPGTAASGYEGITAAEYSGTAQYHHYNGTQGVTNWPLTMEALAYSDTSTATRNLISYGHSTGTSLGRMQFVGTTATFRGRFTGASGSASEPTSTGTYSTATWYYIAQNRDANTGTTRLYQNGAADGTNATTVAAPDYDRFAIGTQLTSSSSSPFDGRVAVALLSSSVRSADYVSTMQDNWAGTMYTAGAWTALDSGCTTGSTGFVLFGAISQTATAAVNWANITDAIVDDFNSADVSLDETTNIESEQLLFSDIQYGTTIPTGADSYTITIRVKVDTEGGGKEINDLLVKFRDDTGTNVGDNLASATQWPSSPGTRDYVVTGYTPDGTEFDADAGLAFSATGFDTAGSTLAEVYVAWIKIDWTCGDDAAKARGFFALTE